LRRADQLVAVLNRPGFILQHKGVRYYDLPLFALFGLLPPNERGGFRMVKRVWKSKPHPLDLFLSGRQSVPITVKEKRD
ncbi:MAG: hypothetical protein ACYTHM_06930, partial [Planctomycetota bacterium]